MTTQTPAHLPAYKLQPIPEGYHTVTPWIVVKGAAQLINYLKKAFGATELGRMTNEDGTIAHAEVKIGDSIMMLFDAKDEWLPTPGFFRLYMENADAIYKQALDAGGVSVTEVTELAFGDRVGRVRDPFGNVWWIQTRMEELDAEEMQKRAGQQAYMKAMQYVEESLDQELSNRSRK